MTDGQPPSPVEEQEQETKEEVPAPPAKEEEEEEEGGEAAPDDDAADSAGAGAGAGAGDVREPLVPQQQQQQQRRRSSRGKGKSGNSNLSFRLLLGVMVAALLPPFYLFLRVYLANRMPISDCDEVYNYWEPLHFLVYGSTARAGRGGTAVATASTSGGGGGGDGGTCASDTISVAAMQTWEYANQYALRTYAYLAPMKWLGREALATLASFPSASTALKRLLVPFLVDSEISARARRELGTDQAAAEATAVSDGLFVFYCLRAALAFAVALAELVWLGAIRIRLTAAGSSSMTVQHANVVVASLALTLLFCAGMAHSAGALLPSSTWTAAYMLASACYLVQQSSAASDDDEEEGDERGGGTGAKKKVGAGSSAGHYMFVVVAVVATLATGWPFGAVLLAPIGMGVLAREYCDSGGGGRGAAAVLKILLWAAAVAAAVQYAVMRVDREQYGAWVSPTYNIFLYNAKGGGDALYGVEPVAYYVKNLLLNLNVVALLGAPAFLVVWKSRQQSELRRDLLTVLIGPTLFWVAITFPRPHKEERFLFPLYPLLCLSAVWVVDSTVNVTGRIGAAFSRHKHVRLRGRILFHAFVVVPAVALSVMRTMALKRYYTAPLQVYARLNSHHLATRGYKKKTFEGTPYLVCTCGEWHRFPSSFFLPGDVQLGFLPSSFQGQLPQPFSVHGSKPESLDVLQPFNDRNLHEASRYVDPSECDYVVDLDSSNDESCRVAPTFKNQKVVAKYPFLDAAETTSTLHRTLYVPYLHDRAVEEGKVKYSQYVLYEIVDDFSHH